MSPAGAGKIPPFPLTDSKEEEKKDERGPEDFVDMIVGSQIMQGGLSSFVSFVKSQVNVDQSKDKKPNEELKVN